MTSINQRTVLLLVFLINNYICDEISPNDIDLITETSQEEALEKVPETDDISNTTEAYNVTEELPEALGLKNETEEEISDEETPVDTTEGIEENTLASVENFYRDDEVFTSPSTVEMKTETTTAPATTRAMDEDELSNVKSESEEDPETTGQRSPKTEGSDSSQTEVRNYDIKPLALPTTKSSTLRSWLEDSWLRPPAAVLVPLRPMALNRALAVWKDLTAEGLNLTDILIVGYDSNGVNWRSRHSLKPSTGIKDRDVAEALSKLLLKYQGVHTDAASDGTMRALASAAKLVPYDSALFVVTDEGPGDLQRLPLALRTLVEKRLKVYTIWTDPAHPSSESERALEGLRSISQHTEGDVLPYTIQVMDVDGASNFASESEMHWQPLVMRGRQGRLNHEFDDRFDTLLVRRGGGEAISLGLPVETGVTALRVYIEGAVEHAVLYPPNDAPQIDLYNETSVSAFSPASRTDGLSPRDVYLLFPGTTFDEDTLSVIPANPKNTEPHTGLVGVWHLSVRCDTCEYRLCITARGQIHLDVASNGADALKLGVTGPVASVRESLLVDEYGTELAKLPFSYQPVAGEGQSDRIDPSSELVADVYLPPVQGSKFYVKIFGRDDRGEPFIRLSGPLHQPEVRLGRSASIVFQDSTNDLERVEEENSKVYLQRYNDSEMNRAAAQVVNQNGNLLTAVQIGLSTRLYGSPGDRLQLHFEVTNHREQSVRFTFGAVGELRFLTGITPYTQTILPGQTANVVVTANIPSSAQPGVRDLVTFTAYAPGSEQVSISAYIYVVASDNSMRDTWAPEVRHNFQGSCIGRMGEDCAQHTWSAVVVARDTGGGLLRITSSPIGLVYNNEFISGTREEVVASYRATCCNPRMLVNAVDAYGNTNSYVVDISNYYSEAMIAVIVLGVILAIALIALVIFLVCLCVRRRKESRELPSFSSSRNIS